MLSKPSSGITSSSLPDGNSSNLLNRVLFGVLNSFIKERFRYKNTISCYNGRMTGADLLPTISASLIKATQLSYVEDAPGTRSILVKLNTILRYTNRKPGDVLLNEEWSIMTTFLELQRIQSPVRFTYNARKDENNSGVYIPRGRLFSPLYEEFQRYMEKSASLISFSLQLVSACPLEVKLMINSDGTVRVVKW